jgi:integrase
MKKNGRMGTASTMNAAIRALMKFINNDKLDVNSLTSNLCKNFYNHLSEGDYIRKCSLYLSYVRRLFNLAVDEYNDEDMGRIVIKVNPFRKFKIPQARKFDRDPTLTPKQIQLIYNMPYTKIKTINLVKDVFIISFLLIGTNAIDLYSCTDFDGEYITYNRSKTKGKRTDNAKIKIKVYPELMPFLEKYKGKKTVFNFCEKYANHNLFNQAIRRGIKNLHKYIQDTYKVDLGHFIFYSARHSWATIARNELNIDKYTVHEALNHVDKNMEITDVYIKKDFSRINEANRKVIDYVINN